MSRRPQPVHHMTLGQFEVPIPNEEGKPARLISGRSPLAEHVQCPRCGNTELYDASSYKSFHWQCRRARLGRTTFAVTRGTPQLKSMVAYAAFGMTAGGREPSGWDSLFVSSHSDDRHSHSRARHPFSCDMC